MVRLNSILRKSVHLALFGLCFVYHGGKGKTTNPVNKIARINEKYGNDHVMDLDIQLRPHVIFEDDVMSAAPRRGAKLWPGGLIPYEIHSSFDRKLKYKRLIESAMQRWESKTCIRFKKRTDEPYFLRIYHGEGCRAEVGYFPGISSLSLGRRCSDLPIILHELGHVIGFWHEQNRPDRDRHVQIVWSNINKKYYHAFRKYTTREISTHAAQYDFYSVMHYGMYSFTKNGGVTIRPRDSSVKRLGGGRLSELDIERTNIMYECYKGRTLKHSRLLNAPGKHGGWSSWSPWKLCSRRCGKGTQARLRSCNSPVPSGEGRQCDGSSHQTRTCNTHHCSDWPRWSSDFKFGVYRFTPKDHSCVRIFERRQYFQWMNYRLCWSSTAHARQLRLRWSDSGAIKDMRCTHITEHRERKSHSWNDNFLCVELDAPYTFTWSSNGPITGLQCLHMRAKRGFDGWDDNFLCAALYPGKISSTRNISDVRT